MNARTAKLYSSQKRVIAVYTAVMERILVHLSRNQAALDAIVRTGFLASNAPYLYLFILTN